MKDLEKLSKIELIAEIRELRKMQHPIVESATEKRAAEIKLKENEEKFRALYDNAPLSYQSLNEDGSFKDVNPTWLRTLGYERNEIIGKFYKDFLHPDWQAHFEDNFPKFKKRGYVNDVEFKIQHKAGHYLDISFEGCIGYNPDGSFKQTFCVFKDITERKQSEMKLDIIYKRLTNTMANMTDGFVSLDTNWNYTYLNERAAEMVGKKPEELIGKHIWTEFPEGIDQPFYKNYHKAFETKQTISFEEYYPPWGLWFENRIIPSEDGLAIFFQDITERKLAEIELVKAKEIAETSENYLDSIINNIGDPIFVKDDHSKLLLVNDAFCSIFGLSRDQIIGKTLAEDVPETERENFLSIDNQSGGKEYVWPRNARISNNIGLGPYHLRRR